MISAGRWTATLVVAVLLPLPGWAQEILQAKPEEVGMPFSAQLQNAVKPLVYEAIVD